MDIKAYVYVDSYDGAMCFKCAVREIINIELRTIGGEKDPSVPYEFDLTLEMGDTGSGNDMRSTPCCVRCGKVMIDHCIA